MQVPSDGVQPPLDRHMHLMCTHQYPLVAHLSLDQAVRFLMEAPMVVKQVAPMSWTYINAPQDGTIWLEWLAPRQNNGVFPSDGYVWGDPEQAQRQDFNGYTVETYHHSAGFRPGIDHMTSHARTRYHLVGKAPQLNAPAPDPSLWIVHYHQAAHNMIMPAVQLPVSNYMKHVMADRRQIEALGRIEQASFMLHDREHWPRVPLPPGYGQQMHPQAMYGHHGAMPNQAGMMMGPRYQPFPNQGPPSAKRQRTHGPGPMLGPGEGMLASGDIEEEEYATVDYFDALTPRDISLERYKQHQHWMEEIFSSPYATQDIVPVDLGLGLMGELKGLTEGIVQEPSLEALLRHKPGQRAKEATFTKLTQAQVDEFGTRVQKFLDDGQAEIERMKAEHASKLSQWQTKTNDYSKELDQDETTIPGVKLYRDVTVVDKGGYQETVENASLDSTKAASPVKIASPPRDAMDVTESTADAKLDIDPIDDAQNGTNGLDVDIGQADGGDLTVPGDVTDMFDGTEFDLANGADDGGLIDFEGGVDIGMDDSAFGDALHGMDKEPGEDTLGEQT